MAEEVGDDPTPAFKVRVGLANRCSKPLSASLPWRKQVEFNDYRLSDTLVFGTSQRIRLQLLPRLAEDVRVERTPV